MTTATTTCWLAYLDLWGFSADVALADPELIMKVLGDVRAVLSATSNVTAHYMFSDSVIVIQERGDQSAWDAFITVVKSVQVAAARNGFVFRGAITTGTMICEDRICFGAPLLEAYRTEQALALPIIAVTTTAERRIGHKLGRSGIIPMKKGLASGSYLMPPPSTIDLISDKIKNTLISGPPEVAETWCKLHKFYNLEGNVGS